MSFSLRKDEQWQSFEILNSKYLFGWDCHLRCILVNKHCTVLTLRKKEPQLICASTGPEPLTNGHGKIEPTKCWKIILPKVLQQHGNRKLCLLAKKQAVFAFA